MKQFLDAPSAPLSMEDFLLAGDTRINEWRAVLADIDRQNKDIAKRYILKAQEIYSAVENFYGKDSLTARYMKKATPGYISHPWYLDRFNSQLKAFEENQRSEAYKARSQDLLERAVAWLHTKGLVLGKDFTLTNAVQVANDIRFNELVAERKANMRGSIEFNGQNCEDHCLGWDGDSRRCDCGNRRVCWEYNGDFDDMYVYGDAY